MAKARHRPRPALAAGVLFHQAAPQRTPYMTPLKDCPPPPKDCPKSPLPKPKAATIACKVKGGAFNRLAQPSTLSSSIALPSDDSAYALGSSVRTNADPNLVSSKSTAFGLEFCGVPRPDCGFTGGVRPPPACGNGNGVCPPPVCHNASEVCPPPVCQNACEVCTPSVCINVPHANTVLPATCSEFPYEASIPAASPSPLHPLSHVQATSQAVAPACDHLSGCLQPVVQFGKCPPPVCGSCSDISTCPPTVCVLSPAAAAPCSFTGPPPCSEQVVQQVKPHPSSTAPIIAADSNLSAVQFPASSGLAQSPVMAAATNRPASCSVQEDGTIQAPAVLEGGTIPAVDQSKPASSSQHPPSYAHVASQSVAPALAQKGFYNNHAPVSGECVIKQPTFHQGKPAVLFKVSEKQQLIGNMKHVLVGKFSHGRPPINVIREFFVKLNLKGEYNLSLFDTRHLFIECTLLEDFTRLWVRLTWHIQRFAMRLFRWTPDFTPERESPLCPVWIHLPRLPLYMFQESCLLSVANTIGRPLSLDSNNVKRIKLGEASICVELDASQPLVHETWVGFEEDTGEDGQPPKVIDGFWQHVVYDDCPAYCLECHHLGHASSACKRGKGKGKAVVQDKIQVEDLGATSSSINEETIQEKVQHEEEPFRQHKQNGSTKRGRSQQKITRGMNVAKSEGAKVQAIQHKYSVPTQNKYVDLDQVDDLSDVCLPHTVSSAPPSPKVPPSVDLNEVGVSEKRPSWADLAEEDITIISKLTLSGAKEYAIKQIEKIMNSDDEGCKTPVTVQGKSDTLAEHAEGNGDDYPAKSSSKSFSTDLPDLDLDPLVDSLPPGGEATKMSALLANSHLLVARRSVSPKRRSSQKLRSLRHKVDTLDFSDDKADLVHREVYSEVGHELQRGLPYQTSY